MSWIGVCDAEQVQEDFPYSGNIDGKEIGIYLIDGEYYALEDVCPHAYALLSQGFVEDGKVECPLHEAVFDVKTGQCLHQRGFACTVRPFHRDQKTFQIKPPLRLCLTRDLPVPES